jgi:hypothetical protein
MSVMKIEGSGSESVSGSGSRSLSRWFGSADPEQNIMDLHHNDDVDSIVVVRICGSGSGPKYHGSTAQ